jgi:hypothetical protein
MFATFKLRIELRNSAFGPCFGAPWTRLVAPEALFFLVDTTRLDAPEALTGRGSSPGPSTLYGEKSNSARSRQTRNVRYRVNNEQLNRPPGHNQKDSI